MTNYNITKIVMITVLIVSATMSGCIEDAPESKMVTWNNGVIVDPVSEPTPGPVRKIDTVQVTEITRPTPMPTPIPTVLPTPTPTVLPTPTPTVLPTVLPTSTSYNNPPTEVWATRSYIQQNWVGIIHIAEWHDDNEIIFGNVKPRSGFNPGDSYGQLELIKIYVDDQFVATIIPNIIDNPNGGSQIMNNTCIIKLPDGLTNSDEIVIMGTFIDLVPDCHDYVDGEYRLHISIHRQDDSYQYSSLDDLPIY